MKSSDQKSFVQTLENVMRFYDKVLDEFTISAFWEILKGYELQDIQDAFLRYIGQKEFAPKPASIIKILDALMEEKAKWACSIVFNALTLEDESLLSNDPITLMIITEGGGWENWISDFRKRFKHNHMYTHFTARYKKHVNGKNNPSPSEKYREEYDQFLESQRPSQPKLIESTQPNPKIKELLAEITAQLKIG